MKLFTWYHFQWAW